MTTNRVPADVIALLEEGLQATRMKSAHFDKPGEHFSNQAYTDEIVESTSLYRSTWVESPVLVALRYLRGEINLDQARREWLVGSGPHIDADIRGF
jgi:hypothetical protein